MLKTRPVLSNAPREAPPAWPPAQEERSPQSMAVATLSSTRTLRRPRRADPRAIVGLVLTLASLAGSVAFWVSATDTRPVLIATHDLPAGATLRGADLGVAYVRVDDAVSRAALPADTLQTLVGRQLGEPVHAQQVLARAQVDRKST